MGREKFILTTDLLFGREKPNEQIVWLSSKRILKVWSDTEKVVCQQYVRGGGSTIYEVVACTDSTNCFNKARKIVLRRQVRKYPNGENGKFELATEDSQTLKFLTTDDKTRFIKYLGEHDGIA